MTTITKERLLTIKQWRETYGPGCNVVLPAEEAEELARIALTSLEAEPIAYIFKHPAVKLFWALTDESNKDQSDVIPVYAAPPVPVVPEEKPMPNPLKMYAVDAVAAIAEVRGWNSCRAAMLHGAEPVSQTYKLNELSGNSPGTPDSWISCSDRMPEKGQNVLISVNFDSSLVEPLICSARYTGSTFRRGEATIKPGNGIEQATHWMPLPEPPQEVN
ncbi:DUF551 domain-containing protein [Escherichia coli]|nr:DUF551 domain-containing protein [Escherichia coli]EME2706027.1 DUF551 domain-containing protein [Escherichia coli]